MARDDREVQSITKDSVATKGKFRILGIDPSNDDHWVEGESESKQKALSIAAKLTRDAIGVADSIDVATVYYVYDDEGNYVGGDVLTDVDLDGYGFDKDTKTEFSKLNKEKAELNDKLEGIIDVSEEGGRYFATLDSVENVKIEVAKELYNFYVKREELEEKSKTLLVKYCGERVTR